MGLHLNADDADAGHVCDHIVLPHRLEVWLRRRVVMNLNMCHVSQVLDFVGECFKRFQNKFEQTLT